MPVPDRLGMRPATKLLSQPVSATAGGGRTQFVSLKDVSFYLCQLFNCF